MRIAYSALFLNPIAEQAIPLYPSPPYVPDVVQNQVNIMHALPRLCEIHFPHLEQVIKRKSDSITG